MVGATLALRWLAPALFPAWESEFGPVELGTAALLVPAMALFAGIVRRRQALPAGWLAAWFALAGIGCLYFAVEELSWGQHLAGWDTPGWLAVLNGQNETNLHNVSSWLNQKPRTLLELWVLASLLVAGARRHGTAVTESGSAAGWFWPGPHTAVAGLLALAVRLPERLESWTGWVRPVPLNIRLSELQEFCFALFLLIYAWEVSARLRRRMPR